MSDSYSTISYGAMMRDQPRIDAYLAALRKVIKPGETTVVELGTGTGIVAFAASLAGAKKVWAIEPNAAIQTAREIAELNGIENIEFLQAMSTDVEIPPADVLLSDMRGITPLYQRHIPSIIDARQRLLKSGGAQISRADDVFFSPVEAPQVWQDAVGYWDENPLGIDMRPAKRLTAASMTHFAAKPDDLLAEPAQLARLDYRTIESAHVQQGAKFEVQRDGVVHGLSIWFETEVDADLRLSTAPGLPLLAYGRPILPLLDPLEVRQGDVLEVSLLAQLVGAQYHWTWAGTVVGDSARSFEHTSIDGADVTLDSIAKLRMNAKPKRTASAGHLQLVLELLDGEHELSEVVQKLSSAAPELGAESALRFVSRVVAEHGTNG